MQSPELAYYIIVFTIVGVIDDVFTLKPIPKLILQTIAGIIAVIFGSTLSLTEGMLVVIWLVIIVNAINFIDGLDGLALSYASVIFIWSLLAQGVNTIILSLLGASLGLLPFNVYHAKLYLGDSGSHALGSAIAMITLPLSTAPIDYAIISIPVADIALVVLTRYNRKVSIMNGGTDHIAHRLARLVGESWCVLFITLFLVLLAGISLLLREVHNLIQLISLAGIWSLIIFLFVVVERRTRSFFA